jgi:hypothetical protein
MTASAAVVNPPWSGNRVAAVGIEGAFLVFVVLGLIAIAFLKVFLQETKGYSLKEPNSTDRSAHHPAPASSTREAGAVRFPPQRARPGRPRPAWSPRSPTRPPPGPST